MKKAMKNVGWFLVILISVLCDTIIKEVTSSMDVGIRYIFTMGVILFFIIKAIVKGGKRAVIRIRAKKEGMTVKEYVKKQVSYETVIRCKALAGNEEELAKYLQSCDEKKIYKEFLFKAYKKGENYNTVTYDDLRSKLEELKNKDSIKYCRNCGSELTENPTFCSKCGTVVYKM